MSLQFTPYNVDSSSIRTVDNVHLMSVATETVFCVVIHEVIFYTCNYEE